MIDREKVIKGIQECDLNGGLIGNCPYKGILAMLKEQEAVETKTEPSAKGYWYTCGACGWWLFEVRDTVHFDDRKRVRFCSSCGRAVKWE